MSSVPADLRVSSPGTPPTFHAAEVRSQLEASFRSPVLSSSTSGRTLTLPGVIPFSCSVPPPESGAIELWNIDAGPFGAMNEVTSACPVVTSIAPGATQ